MNITSLEPDFLERTPTIYSKRKSHSVHLIDKSILNRSNMINPIQPKPPINKLPTNVKADFAKLSQNKNFKTLNKYGLKLDFNNIVYSPFNENTLISANSFKYTDSPLNGRINNNFQNLKNILDKSLQQTQEKDGRHNLSLGFPNLNMKFLYGQNKNVTYINGMSPYHKQKSRPLATTASAKPSSPSTVNKFPKTSLEKKNILNYSSLKSFLKDKMY